MEENSEYPIEKVGNTELPTGFEDVALVLQAVNPRFSSGEIQAVVNAILTQIAEHISAGEDIAFIKRRADGSIDLTMLDLQFFSKKSNPEK